MATVSPPHSSLGHPNMTDGVWFLGDVKEPTPLFEKSRRHRPRCCGQPSHIIHIMRCEGTVSSQMDWERLPVVPLYGDVRAYCSHVKMYCKRACLLSSHPLLSFHFMAVYSAGIGRFLFTPLGTPWEDCGKEIVHAYTHTQVKTTTVCFLSRDVWITLILIPWILN